MELRTGIVWDRGLNPRRLQNQDRYLAMPDLGVFAVFDGVGGQRAGEVASQTALDTIEEAVKHDSASSPSALIHRAIKFANRDVFELAESNPEFRSMATTVALIYVQNGQVSIAHVGDSRVYRFDEGRLHRETIDHTDLDDDIRAGRLARESAFEHQERNVINRALGADSNVEPELKTVSARDGARFLLCSDGIYRHMSDDEIARVLAENNEPQRAADELKRIVLERGADDNFTAIVVQLGRARQSSIAGADGGSSTKPEIASAAQAKRARVASPALRSAERRIQVELGNRTSEYRASDETLEPAPHNSPSRIIIFVLLVLVIGTGAFYGGLRASDWFKREASKSADEMTRGIAAFQREDYPAAASSFESALKREPSNGNALYWLGRTRLEQRDYQQAVQSLEQAIALRPSLYDAYAQAAAAYEMMGDQPKANAMLARYAEERKKEPK